MSQRVLQVPLQNGMETGCELRETIKSYKFVSRSVYIVLHPLRYIVGSAARLLRLRNGSSVRCSEQTRRKTVTQS